MRPGIAGCVVCEAKAEGAAEEREACAKLAEQWQTLVPGLAPLVASHWKRADFAAEVIAEAIRARGAKL